MKRIWALFLVFILIFSITACGMNTSRQNSRIFTTKINPLHHRTTLQRRVRITYTPLA